MGRRERAAKRSCTGIAGLCRSSSLPTEPVLASWGSDNTARLWDIETGRELLCLCGHRRSDRSTFPEIAFNADGTYSPRAVRMRP